MNLLAKITETAINPALLMLPPKMDSAEARVMLLAIGLQESEFIHRYQIVAGGRPGAKGPARGFWQFERGSMASRGGMWGVFLHPASAALIRDVSISRGVAPQASNAWEAVETDDVLAAAAARLLLYTDALPLPKLGDEQGAWALYAKRAWRPGKPHPDKWPANYAQALAFVRKG